VPPGPVKAQHCPQDELWYIHVFEESSSKAPGFRAAIPYPLIAGPEVPQDPGKQDPWEPSREQYHVAIIGLPFIPSWLELIAGGVEGGGGEELPPEQGPLWHPAPQ